MTQISGNPKPFQIQDRGPLLLSIALQCILAIAFGNLYDMRISMATGYLVGSGHNPYDALDLGVVFHNGLFNGISTFGYPPPWALVLGIIYKSVYAVIPNFLLYNFAIKIPILSANICLAFLIARLLDTLGAEASVSKRARNFLLLNPAVLIFSSAWGQIDSIVALISLASLILLNAKKLNSSAILLALAISIKPIALPLTPAVFVYLFFKDRWKTVQFFSVFFAGAIVFCAAPFIIFGWAPSVIFKNWNAHFTVAGCMSFMSISEIWNKSFQLKGPWQGLGMLWAPALLCFTVYSLRFKITGFKDLLKLSTAMIFVFFLTRTWVSEPNVLMMLPFVLLLTSMGELNRLVLTLAWALPLGFSVFNGSLAALLFPTMPGVMNTVFAIDNEFRVARLLARTIVVLPWLFVGGWIVLRCMKKKAPLKALSPNDEREAGLPLWK